MFKINYAMYFCENEITWPIFSVLSTISKPGACQLTLNWLGGHRLLSNQRHKKFKEDYIPMIMITSIFHFPFEEIFFVRFAMPWQMF